MMSLSESIVQADSPAPKIAQPPAHPAAQQPAKIKFVRVGDPPINVTDREWIKDVLKSNHPEEFEYCLRLLDLVERRIHAEVRCRVLALAPGQTEEQKLLYLDGFPERRMELCHKALDAMEVSRGEGHLSEDQRSHPPRNADGAGAV